MRERMAAAALVLVLAACDHGPCPQLHGVYRAVFTEHDGGSCGALASAPYVDVPGGAATLAPYAGCTGTRTIAADCTWTDAEHCEQPGGVTEDFEVHAHVDATGVRMFGTDHERFVGPAVDCSSDYDVTYELVSRTLPPDGG